MQTLLQAHYVIGLHEESELLVNVSKVCVASQVDVRPHGDPGRGGGGLCGGEQDRKEEEGEEQHR